MHPTFHSWCMDTDKEQAFYYYISYQAAKVLQYNNFIDTAFFVFQSIPVSNTFCSGLSVYCEMIRSKIMIQFRAAVNCSVLFLILFTIAQNRSYLYHKSHVFLPKIP